MLTLIEASEVANGRGAKAPCLLASIWRVTAAVARSTVEVLAE
jgi:hypothetical protein